MIPGDLMLLIEPWIVSRTRWLAQQPLLPDSYRRGYASCLRDLKAFCEGASRTGDGSASRNGESAD
jgi:hypothetical protein